MKNRKLPIIFCLLSALAFGCKKQSFMLPAEGEQVPYQEETLLTLKESLAKSSATLFYAAWQRSNMDALLKSLTIGKTYFTFLVPGNAALESAGYNLQKLQSMTSAELDNLLMFYTLYNSVTAEELAGKTDNYIAKTLLNIPVLRENTYPLNEGGVYYYRHYLQVKDGKTFVNGKVAGSGKSERVKEGNIWFLDQPIYKPEKTVLEFVETDGRFTLLLQIMRYTDKQYNQIRQDAIGIPGDRMPATKRFGWELVGNNSRQVVPTTLFLPTDDAFKAAGFNTLQDLLRFNQQRGLPFWGINQYGGMSIIGNYATDTLLNYHLNWGKMINLDSEVQAAKFPINVPVFYSNVMSNSVLSSYVIAGAVNVNNTSDSDYYMPLDFSKDAGGNVQVKVKGADAIPARVIDPDINTLNGPVHVVDHLLVPKNFKLN